MSCDICFGGGKREEGDLWGFDGDLLQCVVTVLNDLLSLGLLEKVTVRRNDFRKRFTLTHSPSFRRTAARSTASHMTTSSKVSLIHSFAHSVTLSVFLFFCLSLVLFLSRFDFVGFVAENAFKVRLF